MASYNEIRAMQPKDLLSFTEAEWEGVDHRPQTQALIAALARRIVDLETDIAEINDKLRAVNRDSSEVEKQLDRLEKKADRHDANLRELFRDRS